MRRMKVVVVGLVLAATAVSHAAPGSRSVFPSPQRAQQSPNPTFRSNADYVELDVYVTDRQGRFLRDLRKEQFRILESGQPQDVATLRLVDVPRATTTTRAAVAAAPAAAAAVPAPAGAVDDPAPDASRMYFLVLDDLHTRPEGSPRLRSIADQFIERCVAPTDRAAVVLTSGRQNAVQELTGNAKLLMAAVNRFVGHKVPSPTLLTYGGPAKTPVLPDRTQPGEDDRLSQARSAMDTLTRIIEYAGSFHGRRKTIILFSEGVDIDLNTTNDRLRQVKDQIVSLSSVANRANVTIYAIDPRGVTQGGEHAAEVGGETGYAATPQGGLPGASQASFQDELRSSQEGMQTLAVGTAGMAFVNTGDLDRIFRLVDEASSTYYLLSYSSSTPIDGKFHPVEVKIDVPGATVRARKGFVKSPVAPAVPPAAPAVPPAAPVASPAAPVVPPVADVPAPAATPAVTAAPVVPTAPPAAASASAIASPPAAPTEAETAVARNVDDLVKRARGYVVDYGAELSLVIGVERYRQWVLNSDSPGMGVVTGDRPQTHETVSEFALVRIKDDWLGYRDVYQVDGKTVGDRQDRLQRLFQQNPTTAIDQGRKIADESARYNAGGLQRNFNIPTLALFFLHPSNASRFRFELAGTDTIDGVPVSKVRYREAQEPTIVRTSAGKNMPVNGIFWVETASGRVLKTSMEITSEARLSGYNSKMEDRYGANASGGFADTRVDAYSRVTTSYKLDRRLGLLLPIEMVEEYQGVSVNRGTGKDRITKINCRATYSDFKKFETGGRLVIPK